MGLHAGGCGRDLSRIHDPLERADVFVERDHNADAYYERAVIRNERGMKDGALADSDAALTALSPMVRNPCYDLYKLRADIHKERGDFAAALADADGMRSETRDSSGWQATEIGLLRIDLLIALGRSQEAEDIIAPMLACGPASLNFGLGMGRLEKLYSARK